MCMNSWMWTTRPLHYICLCLVLVQTSGWGLFVFEFLLLVGLLLAVADEVKDKPVLIPVPIPVYLPTPMALYTAPAPTPIFIPVPIPVPIFIPTTRKSASGIMKQIKVGRMRIQSQCVYPQLILFAAVFQFIGQMSQFSVRRRAWVARVIL